MCAFPLLSQRKEAANTLNILFQVVYSKQSIFFVWELKWTKELPLSLQCLFSVSFCPATSEEQSLTLKPFTYQFQVENFFVSTHLSILTRYSFLINEKGKSRNTLEKFCLYHEVDTYLESLENQFVSDRTAAWCDVVESYPCHGNVVGAVTLELNLVPFFYCFYLPGLVPWRLSADYWAAFSLLA